MSENIGLNGKNGSSFNIPLALVLFIILETGTGIWLLSSLNTKMEMIQQQVIAAPVNNELFKKNIEEKIELRRLEQGGMEKDIVILKVKAGIK